MGLKGAVPMTRLPRPLHQGRLSPAWASVVQSVISLIADQGVISLILARPHTFLAIMNYFLQSFFSSH